MKLRRALGALGAAALLVFVGMPDAAASPTGGLGWSIPNRPAEGFKEIRFYLTIHEMDDTAGWYFAYQFRTTGGHGSYIGLQPKSLDKDGKQVVQAIFSNFSSGTTENDPNCSGGADGGPGASCSIRFTPVMGHTYRMQVISRGEGSWEGVVSDMATNEYIHIGTWRLNGTQLLDSSQMAWAERYRDGYNCTLSAIPLFRVTYRAPIGYGVNGERSNGSITKAKEGGPCTGKQGFMTDGSGSRVNVKAGS